MNKRWLTYILVVLIGNIIFVPVVCAVSIQISDLEQKLSSGPKKDYVLNAMNLGLADLGKGDFQKSEQLFDSILFRIESIYANNPDAAKARSLWYDEDIKDFKGEPYERAMAYFYRAILYMMHGDYENARACAKSGQLQDAFAEEEQNQTDFALLMFIEAWSSQQLGDNSMATDAYAELKKFRPDFPLPKANDNLLVIAETGKAPRKLADGVGHYELLYRRGKHFKEKVAAIDLGHGQIKAYPMEDIFYQAATRGGRPVDRIIKGKVSFRNTDMEIGTTLTTASSVASIASSASSGLATAGAALGGIGGIMTLMAVNTKAKADVRYWGNLPDTVHIYTAHSIQSEGKATFFNGKDEKMPAMGRKFSVIFDKKGHGIAWVRSRSVLELK